MSMLEVMNTSSQTISANGSVGFTTTNIPDGAGRMTYNSTNGILLKVPGTYKVSGVFNVYNSDASSSNVSIQMYADGVAISGTQVYATVPAAGYEEIVIEKNVSAIPAKYGDTAAITFVSPSGCTVVSALADVYKRA